MTEKIIIAGSGGQGIMLLGKVLASAAMKESKYVTWLPAYGPEVRGGAAYCMVIISDEEIGSPFIGLADTLIVLNSLAYEKFKTKLKNSGLLILNSSFEHVLGKTSGKILKYPFTMLANNLGNIKVANMIALGVYLNNKKIINAKKVFQVMQEMAPKKEIFEINRKAFSEGMELEND